MGACNWPAIDAVARRRPGAYDVRIINSPDLSVASEEFLIMFMNIYQPPGTIIVSSLSIKYCSNSL